MSESIYSVFGSGVTPADEPLCPNCRDVGCEFCGAVEAEEYDEVCGDDFDEPMDGDAASALASCGWGVDEDYYHDDYDCGDWGD